MQPNNSMIDCSLGDDSITSYEDTCNFMCNPGYELMNNYKRICQHNGSWSGVEAICEKGVLMFE